MKTDTGSSLVLNSPLQHSNPAKLGSHFAAFARRLLLVLLAVGAAQLQAATYYSTGSVTPNTLANWKSARDGSGSSPANFTAGDTFVIQSGHNMPTTATMSISGVNSKLWIENGGTLTANNAVTLNAATTFQIDGGGTYIHNNTGAYSTTIFQGTENFAASSTVEIRASNTTGPSSVAFGNLTINFTTDPTGSVNCAGGVTTINGNLTVITTGTREFRLTANTSLTLTIGGNLVISGGSLNFANGAGAPTINLGGNFNMTGGTMVNPSSVSTLAFSGGLASVGFTQSGGTYNNGSINYTIASGKTLSLNNNLPVAASRTLTVNGTLATGVTFTGGSGGITINGTFRINQGGWATGGTWTYGASSTLEFANTSGLYGVNADVFWPAASGPVNLTVSGAGGLQMNVSRAVSGTFQTAAQVTGSAITLNGIAQINAGGYFSTAPIYGASSTLKYNTGATYGRGTEWSAASGTIGTTPGYPNNILISGNSTLNYPNSASYGAQTINGSLTVDSGSSFYMDYGSPAANGALTVSGSVSLAGNLSLGNQLGGDMIVKGHWTRTGGTFSPNSRAVFFQGTSTQYITGATTFDYVALDNATGLMLYSPVIVNQTLTLTTGELDLNGQDLAADKLAGTRTVLNGSVTTSTLTVGGNNGTGQFDGTIGGGTDAINLVKTGSGDLLLNQVCSFSGTTTVSGTGRLIVDAYLISAGGIMVNSTATLGGNSTIDSDTATTIAGTLAPGSSVGQLNTGPQTWAPGGSYEVEMTSATGAAGVEWDYTDITGNLTINATNNAGDSGKFTITLVNVGASALPDNFSAATSNSWKIAEVTDGGSSVAGFTTDKFRVVLSNFTPTPSGTFNVVLNGKAVELMYAPLACTTTDASFAVDKTNPDSTKWVMVMAFSNTVGLASIQPLRMDNCTMTGISYNSVDAATNLENGTALGALTMNVKKQLTIGTKKVVLWAAKVDGSATAVVNALAINTCGYGKNFDPVFTTLGITSGDQVQQRFEGILSAERYLQVLNGTPGLRWLEVNLNGRIYRLDPLTNGQTVAADLVDAMLEGENNVVILTGGGEVGASAVVTITDTPGGNMISLPEVVRLTLRQTGEGLVLSWPETLVGWSLQSSASPDGGWASVNTAPAAVDGQLTVSVPTPYGGRFYRLSGPARAVASAVPAAATPSADGISAPTDQATQQESTKRIYDGVIW